MPDTTMLIVEDEVIVAADLARKLGRLGYMVCGSTTSGEDALALVREHRPDLVLMDISLAGEMDGVEAAEHIRRECDVPVIYLTAHADCTTLDRAKRTEPFGYIIKSFDERELESHIEMALYKHQAERKLRESEERFRSVLDNSLDVIYRLNVQTGRYEYISPSAETVVGFSPAELQAQYAVTVLAMIHPDDLPAMRAALARLEETGVVEVEYRQRAKNGDYRWMSNHMRLSRDSVGQPLYRDGSIRDITERKHVEEALRQSEGTMRAILEAAQESICLYSADGQILLANPTALQRLGKASDEVIGKHFRELLPAALATSRRAHIQRIIDSGQPLDIEDERAGIQFSHSSYPVFDANGHVKAIATFSRDITVRKQAEEALQWTGDTDKCGVRTYPEVAPACDAAIDQCSVAGPHHYQAGWHAVFTGRIPVVSSIAR